ncbi:hypothetical protein [Allokutzneria sp. NRRL B-24872]|uniref:hypothetical protein n=1 Tax=Allokutzneria sp. NRRL B-24872 TaxID=1137961 RepID=UPI001178A717|nr:hypothetical protein [Allokutzneria sp. NRRL B-24872]
MTFPDPPEGIPGADNSAADVYGAAVQGGDYVQHGDTTTNHNHGPSNTGSGSQINNFFNETQRRRREARRVANEHVRWLAERFVAPQRYPENALQRPGSIVLMGARGTGLRTAALMVLTQRGKIGLEQLRELSDVADGPGEQALDQGGLRDDERLLLDLTNTDDAKIVLLRAELDAYRAAVESKRARLVVVIRRDQEHLLRGSFTGLIVDLEPPNGSRLLQRHLHAAKIHVSLPLPAETGTETTLEDYLATASVRDIVGLARLTTEACATQPRGTPDTWLQAALNARSAQGGKAAELFQQSSDGNDRALLVVAGFLAGRPLEALIDAEASFQRLVGLPPDKTHVLNGRYLAQRMRDIGLRAEGERSVTFAEFGCDGAVRHHFWTYFAELRPRMPDWVARTVALPGLTAVDTWTLVDRFAQQVLTTGPVHLLTDLARRLSAHKTELALQVFSVALHHHELSGPVREQIYNWARDPNLPSPLAKVLISTCIEELAPHRPTQALVRLRWLTRHRDGEVSSRARTALLDLVVDRGFQRWLLYQWANAALRDEDRATLFELNVSERIAKERQTRRNLIACWRKVLIDGFREVPPEAVHRWLSRDPELLVAACDRRVPRLNELYLLAREWVLATPRGPMRQENLAHVRQLQRHINHAVGTTALENP